MRYSDMIKLPESELEVMMAIWQLDVQGEKEISAGKIMDAYPDLCRLKLTTVLTLITRLHTKGFIKSEKIGRSNCYIPLITLKDYRKFALDDFAEHVFLKNKVDFIKSILSDGTLTKKEVTTLKEYFNSLI